MINYRPTTSLITQAHVLLNLINTPFPPTPIFPGCPAVLWHHWHHQPKNQYIFSYTNKLFEFIKWWGWWWSSWCCCWWLVAGSGSGGGWMSSVVRRTLWQILEQPYTTHPPPSSSSQSNPLKWLDGGVTLSYVHVPTFGRAKAPRLYGKSVIKLP